MISTVAQRTGSFLKHFSRFPPIALLVWLALYIPRIWSLGFYYGDSWATIVAVSNGNFHTYGSLSNLIIQFAPKPVAIFTHLLFVAIAGDNTYLWQAGLAAACLIGAVILYRFLSELDRKENRTYSMQADLATALWLAMPLDLGATVLPNMFNALLGQAMFFGYGLILLRICRAEDIKRNDLFLAGGLLVASYLSYEAYYFQFLVPLGLIFLFNFSTISWRRLALLFAFTSALQGLCILYNRNIGFINPGLVGSKTFNSAWRDLINVDALRSTLDYNLAHALGDFLTPSVYCLYVILGAAICACLYRFFKKDWKISAVFTVGLLLLAISYVLAATTYALAGYGLTYMGVESRVAMVPVFLFALAAFLCFTVARGWKPAGVLACTGGLTLIVVMGLLTHVQVKPWRISWELQRKVLRQFDHHTPKLKQLTSASCVVFIGPYYIGPAPIFQADIQLSIAAKERFEPFQKWDGISPYFLSVHIGHRIKLLDDVLIQDTPGGSETRKECKDVWYWNYFENKFRRMKNGEYFDPEQFGVNLPAPTFWN